MIIPCPKRIDCDCLDFPISNYTAEDPDSQLSCVTGFYGAPPPLGGQNVECPNSRLVPSTQHTCCEELFRVAQICAFNGARRGLWETWTDPNDPTCQPPTTYCNTEQTATSLCDDGSEFTAVVAACTIYALSQEDADAQALALAQQRAEDSKFCCPPNDVCCCVGDTFERTITIDGGTGPFTWTPVSGDWPTGIDFSEQVTGAREMLISGVASTAGATTISYYIYDPEGNFLTKTFTVYAIEIATTSLTAYTVGVPYSHQMLAIGGSGSYAWRITSGTLPAGLVMSLSGLISGTPTETAVRDIAFDVIDLACATTDRTFFQPRIRMTGTSTTRIATVRGFSPFTNDTVPPTKYKQLDWTGTSEQSAYELASNQTCAGAKYIWSGTSLIDGAGKFISKYQKNFYAQCNDDPPLVISDPNFGLSVLKGYCWQTDPSSCPACVTPYPFVANVSGNTTLDTSDFIGGGGISTQTTLTNNSTISQLVLIQARPTFPTTDFNGIVGAWVMVTGTHNYSATLSVEYTDAEALANAQVLIGNGLATENRPRTTGYTSYYTSSVYSLACSNLVIGEIYNVEVEFVSDTGTKTEATHTFTATATTEVITGNVPTPTAGHTIEARNATIEYAT